MIRPSVKIGVTKVALYLHLFTSLVAADEISELARVEERVANSSKQGIAAGIIGGVGAVFTLAGLSDCN